MTQSSPSPLEGRRLISLTVWARIGAEAQSFQVRRPLVYKSVLTKGTPFSFMRLILAFWVPFSLQSALWVGSEDRHAGRAGEEATKVNADAGHAESVPPPSKQGLQAWKTPRQARIPCYVLCSVT